MFIQAISHHATEAFLWSLAAANLFMHDDPDSTLLARLYAQHHRAEADSAAKQLDAKRQSV